MVLSYKNTLKVQLDNEQGLIELQGKSILENTADFYKPVMDWMDEYTRRPNANTTVNLSLEYLNTLSSKQLFVMLKKVEQLHESGSSFVNVNWYYEMDDELMMIIGEEFKSIFNMPINLIELEEFDFVAN